MIYDGRPCHDALEDALIVVLVSALYSAQISQSIDIR